MGESMSESVQRERDAQGFITLRLNRPDVHNAFDAELIATLTAELKAIAADDSARGVVLTGNGKSFSAGADLNWMKSMVEAGEEENKADALRLAELMRTLEFLPIPTVAMVNGAAMGGGVGLVACCDIAIAAESAKFALSEAKLGLVPAVISPYVIRRMGAGQARRYFLTAEIFDAQRAEKIGLVSETVADDALESTVEQQKRLLGKAGPLAQRHGKQLISLIQRINKEDQQTLDDGTAALIAKLRILPEGQEGMAAFLEKRAPSWDPKNH
jgi:methylglutaconyl-CoA hydratase